MDIFTATDPVSQILVEMLRAASAKGASDIHIEPKEFSLEIRFRIQGDLTLWKKLPREALEIIIHRAKVLFNLDLGVASKPQDSRQSFSNLKFDVRVNSVPTIYGEKIVLRLLRLDRAFDIDRAGLDPAKVEILKHGIKNKDGLIIISGPTGSGKTTTLYNLVSAIDAKRKNISTLENPVEYRLAGVTQIDVGEKGMSFAQGLRALMRQDPDVILVGEIRDEETAELCFKAASTGHLVLSTIHANSSLEVISRLERLGVEKYLIESCLRLSVAQRLIQLLCETCCLEFGEGLKARNFEGCKNCHEGLSGRLPLIEIATKENFLGNRQPLEDSLNDQIKCLAAAGKIDASDLLD